jgi:hypothetical protein
MAFEGEVDLVDAAALRRRTELRLRAVRGAAEKDAILGLHPGSSRRFWFMWP